jgi:hypothetical protein
MIFNHYFIETSLIHTISNIRTCTCSERSFLIVECDTTTSLFFSNLHVLYLQAVLVAGSTRLAVWYFNLLPEVVNRHSPLVLIAVTSTIQYLHIKLVYHSNLCTQHVHVFYNCTMYSLIYNNICTCILITLSLSLDV